VNVKRTIPPAAAPLGFRDLARGILGWWFGRRAITSFEQSIRLYFGVRHVFTVASGKAALALILLALRDRAKRRKVIIPAYTCYSVPSAVLKAGLDLTLCDVDPATFDFEYSHLERIIDEETLCIVPCHLFGISADMGRIRAMADRVGAVVVEDAAQAMGGTRDGRKLGTIGDVGFFSLGRGKNITCGSGGIIVTNSDQIAEALQRRYLKLKAPSVGATLGEWLKLLFMTIFINPNLYWFPAGLPFLRLGETTFYRDFPIERLSGMQGGLLSHWRTHLERSNQKRHDNGVYFRERINGGEAAGQEKWIPYLRFPILTRNRQERDGIFARSNERGFGVSLMYPKAVHQIEEIIGRFRGEAFPSAEEIAARLVAIPTHSYVSSVDRERIRELIVAGPYTAAASRIHQKSR